MHCTNGVVRFKLSTITASWSRTGASPIKRYKHGYWQPSGSLAKGGSDFSKRWAAFSVWWQLDRESKYVDNELGIMQALKWTVGVRSRVSPAMPGGLPFIQEERSMTSLWRIVQESAGI